MEHDLACDVLVLGAGPGGYSAAFRAADLGLKVVLVERFPTLGGVCLNVGCIPSKALLHVAAVMDEVSHFEALGITFAPPTIDLARLKAHKDKVIGRLTGGLAAMGIKVDKEVVGQMLLAAGVDPARRAETLTMEEWARVQQLLGEHIHAATAAAT